MKHLTLFLTIFIISSCSKEKIEPSPPYIPEWIEIRGEESEYNTFFGIDFVDNNFGVICSGSESIFKTVDGGVTWEKIELGVNMFFYRASVLNKNIFAVEARSTFVTKDGGKSFSEITFQDTNSNWIKYFRDIHFIDTQTWYGRGGKIYKTTDGGINWNIIYPDIPGGMNELFISSLGIIYAYGGSTTEYFVGGGEFISSGFLSKSTDGGANWIEFKDSVITSSELTGAYFFKNLGFIDPVGSIYPYRTTNGGVSWELMDLVDLYPYRMCFISERTGYSLSREKQYLYKTTDGGLNWEIDLEVDTLRRNFSMIVNTENYLYLLSKNGAVYKKSIE